MTAKSARTCKVCKQCANYLTVHEKWYKNSKGNNIDLLVRLPWFFKRFCGRWWSLMMMIDDDDIDINMASDIKVKPLIWYGPRDKGKTINLIYTYYISDNGSTSISRHILFVSSPPPPSPPPPLTYLYVFYYITCLCSLLVILCL